MARKGVAAFLKERFIRLGLPLAVFGVLLGPFTESLAGMAAPGHLGWPQVFAETAARIGEGRINLGPLWFAYALLLFSVAYVLLRPWIAGLGATIKAAGPFTDDIGSPVGSLLIVEAGNRAGAEAIAAADPYARAGLFAAVDIRPWKWLIKNPEAA